MKTLLLPFGRLGRIILQRPAIFPPESGADLTQFLEATLPDPNSPKLSAIRYRVVECDAAQDLENPWTLMLNFCLLQNDFDVQLL